MLFLRALAVALAFAGINGVGIILVDERGRFLVNLRGRRSSKPDVGQRPAPTLLPPRPGRREELRLGEGIEHRLVTPDEVPALHPRAPLLRAVLRAFAGTRAYEACLRDARQTTQLGY